MALVARIEWAKGETNRFYCDGPADLVALFDDDNARGTPGNPIVSVVWPAETVETD
jgi:hypothetical protein